MTERFEKTKAGMQCVLITEQRTQKNLGAIRSNIPLSKQLEGTMFEKHAEPEQSLFDKESK